MVIKTAFQGDRCRGIRENLLQSGILEPATRFELLTASVAAQPVPPAGILRLKGSGYYSSRVPGTVETRHGRHRAIVGRDQPAGTPLAGG